MVLCVEKAWSMRLLTFLWSLGMRQHLTWPCVMIKEGRSLILGPASDMQSSRSRLWMFRNYMNKRLRLLWTGMWQVQVRGTREIAKGDFLNQWEKSRVLRKLSNNSLRKGQKATVSILILMRLPRDMDWRWRTVDTLELQVESGWVKPTELTAAGW